MTKIDLITGFLGSGKTTFIRKYVDFLVRSGESVGIIENDYGAINVDMLLLNDLKEKGVGLEMVAGGGDFDCHQRRFRTKLITMSLLGYTRVIVEPSGIFDVDEFFDLLHEDELYDRYQIGNVLAIVNANLEDCISDQENYMLASQVAQAGRVVLSFVDEVVDNKIMQVKNHLQSALQMIKCTRVLDDSLFVAKAFDELDDSDFQQICKSGYRETGYVKLYSIDRIGFRPLFFLNPEGSLDEILSKIKSLWNESDAGNVLRIKGFIQQEGIWYEINANQNHMSLNEIGNGQSVLIVIGENLNEAFIDKYFKSEFSTLRTN